MTQINERSTGRMNPVAKAPTDTRSPRPSIGRLLLDRIVPVLIFLAIYAPSFGALAEMYREGAPWIELANKTLTVLFLLLLLILFVVRFEPTGKRSSLLGKLIAIAGTFGVGLFALNADAEVRPALMGIGAVIQLFGLVWAVTSLAYLGRSFGIFPEARGLVRKGPYRIVRHPLYFGELVVFLGAFLAEISPTAIVLWLMIAGLQVWRTVHEERVLKRAFPEQYTSYAAQTKRMVPFVW